jgi:hypothetical protein
MVYSLDQMVAAKACADATMANSMNPTVLNFSKGWSLVQLALMVGAGVAIFWLLSESSVFADPPPLPAPPAEFRFDTEMFEYSEKLRAAQPRQEYGFDRLTGGWFSVILLVVCLPLALWEICIKLWRLFAREPALAMRNGQLIPHRSFTTTPTSIPVNAISNVVFDRTDRVRSNTAGLIITAFSWSAHFGGKLGGRLRHSLLIDYVSESGEQRSFRIGDADVDGGVEQLKRFADYLKMILGGYETCLLSRP